jgi:hypothetical protein
MKSVTEPNVLGYNCSRALVRGSEDWSSLRDQLFHKLRCTAEQHYKVKEQEQCLDPIQKNGAVEKNWKMPKKWTGSKNFMLWGAEFCATPHNIFKLLRRASFYWSTLLWLKTSLSTNFVSKMHQTSRSLICNFIKKISGWIARGPRLWEVRLLHPQLTGRLCHHSSPPP